MPSAWIIYAILSAVFAALVAVFGKIGVAGVDATIATTLRAVIMAVFLILLSLAIGKAPLLHAVHNRALLFIILSGIAGALSWLCYFVALRTGPASGVAALDRLSVVFVLVLAVLFLSESFSWKHGLGAVLLTLGAALMGFYK